MTSNPPWSVKGIDRATRATAKKAAAAEGLTLGAWIDRAVLESAQTNQTTESRHADEPFAEGVVAALETLVDRAEAAEARTAALLEPVRDAVDRLDNRLTNGGAPPSADSGASPAPAPSRRRARWPAGIAASTAVIAAGALAYVWYGLRAPTPPDASLAVAEAPATKLPATEPARPPEPAQAQAETETEAEAEVEAEKVDPVVAGLMQAAKTGNAKAQHDLGILYAKGDIVGRDYERAWHWFREASLQGLANAQYNLGVLYENGLGIAADAAQAVIWYHSAADQGHANAQHNLGVLYAEGRGLPQNYEAAESWFRKAADQNVAEAAYSLGMIHEHGLGKATDAILAYKWYSLAANAGSETARSRLAELTGRLSPETVAKAQALVVGSKTGATMSPEIAARPPAPAPANLAPTTSAPTTSGPTRADIREMQRLLRTVGFDPGPADGLAGRRTRDAIRRYQKMADLAIDGKPTRALVGHLRTVAGMMTNTGAN